MEDPTIDKLIKARNLQWLDHMERMGEGKIPRIIAPKMSQYKKGRGRPEKLMTKGSDGRRKEEEYKRKESQIKNRKEWKRMDLKGLYKTHI